ncbi:MAG: sugar phosphate isomerase/epimerase family protein [Thermoguttaceae bacterium]
MNIARRNLLRNTAVLSGAGILTSLSSNLFAQELPHQSTQLRHQLIYSKMLGWDIGPQIYSFRLFTFEEAIKKTAEIGARTFEVFCGQRLNSASENKVGPDMSKSDFKLMQQYIADSGCVPVAVGVCGADKKFFDFAASLAIQVINSEPAFEQMESVNKLADEYKINVGLHNHPKPSRYWDPDVVLEQLKNCGSRVGACCDTGHWVRSGLDPVECVKKLQGKIISFHIKDLNSEKRDVPLGKGVCRIADVLKEAANQHVRGPFSIEYESDWENNAPFIAEGIQFFTQTSKDILFG